LFEVKFSAWLRRRKKEVTQMYVSFLLEKFGFMSSKKSKIRTLSMMMMSMRRIHDFVLV
jgi:ABC-type multidrug transport system ATPase subunit